MGLVGVGVGLAGLIAQDLERGLGAFIFTLVGAVCLLIGLRRYLVIERALEQFDVGEQSSLYDPLLYFGLTPFLVGVAVAFLCIMGWFLYLDIHLILKHL